MKRLATLVMLALAGCTLGPDYVAPVPPAPLESGLPYVPAGLATRAEVGRAAAYAQRWSDHAALTVDYDLTLD